MVVMETAEGTRAVSQVLEGNPAYRHLYRELIVHCREECALEEAFDFCESARTSKSQILSAAAMVDVMVRCGALEQRILVDGEPYEGSLEELQADETLPEDACVSVYVQATGDGLAAAAVQDEERSLDRLLEEHPRRAAAFSAVLKACADAQGCTTRQLQELLKGADLLETEEARGIDGLHASYFTGALEAVGALAWNGKAWIVTERRFCPNADGSRRRRETKEEEED